MKDKSSYFIPAESITVEQEIKRSRFICSSKRAINTCEANDFIKANIVLYPDARHHCYAFIAGNPKSTTNIGMSDDGEPQGTAGKPMLSILKYSGIGEIVVVVVRYFGGTKLGTGGLVRAYSSSVQLALDAIKLKKFVMLETKYVSFSYQYESSLRYIFEKMNVAIKEISYLEKIVMTIEFPKIDFNQLCLEINNKTKGEAAIY